MSICHVGCSDRRAASIGFHKSVSPDDDAVPRRTRRDVVLHADEVPRQPEAIAVDTKILLFGSQVDRDFAVAFQSEVGVHGSNGDVVLDRTDLITSFGVKRRPMNVVGYIVRHRHIRRMIHQPIAGAANNHTAVHDSWFTAWSRSAAMEVNRVATAYVVASSRRRCEDSSGTRKVTNNRIVEVKVEVIERDFLVRPTEVSERGVVDVDVVGVHEHEVTTMRRR